MMTVRAKLILLVLGCVTPAVVGAVVNSRTEEQQMLEQVSRRVDGANRRFETELDEYQQNSRIALSFAEHSQRFPVALQTGDAAGATRLVERLAAVYTQRIILAADKTGKVLVRGNADIGPASLAPDSSPAFAELLANKPLVGFIPVQLTSGPSFALVSAAPVEHEGAQVGALALLSPITASYLEQLEKKVNADLAISVDGKLVASTSGHPAPHLKSHAAEVALIEEGDKIFAVKTFRPEGLKRAGLVVELTASRDVTELRDAVRDGLRVHLGGLALGLLVVLGLALRFASRFAATVRGLSEAAREVKTGHYVNAPVIKTGDELESLSVDFNEMIQGLKERDHLKETFGRYVTRQVADHLMKGNQVLGGELVPVTVLFSDIRSFTSISETMEPRALLDFLNEYFSGMVESVMQHHGVVDKFIGDAIMAVFGAPVPEAEDPLHAVKAALEMRSRLLKINVEFKVRGLPEIRAGIGLHSGQVVAGNMGHSERMEYTVIGDAVNLASRLEGMTKELGCDIILSEDLYEQVKVDVDAEPLRKIKVKGRDQEVMVYRLIGLRADA